MSNKQDIIDGMIQECLEADDGLECLTNAFHAINAMPKQKGLCKPRLVMLTDQDCPNCADMRTIHSGLLSTGIAKEVDATSNRGKRIGHLNRVDGVPALLLLDCKDELIGEIYSDAEVEEVV